VATLSNSYSQYNSEEVGFNHQQKTIGVVTSNWNSHITHNLEGGALQILRKHGVGRIEVIRVPGSFELVAGCIKLHQRLPQLDAIICLGSVIRGETAHFDYVCSAVSNGIMDLNIRLQIPVIFGVLTDDNEDQAIARSGGSLGNKGIEAAVTALLMSNIE